MRLHALGMAVLSALLFSGLARAVEFDCVTLPPDLKRSPDCDDPNSPFYNPDWCACLKSGLTANKAGEHAAIEQAIIDSYHQPTVGRETMTVGGGTLDLSGLSPGDPIGELKIDLPVGAPENFLLDFQMNVSTVNQGSVDFDVVIVDTNATSIQILGYDPTDDAHSGGLVFKGQVKSFGALSGFELSYQYLTPDDLPAGATSAGLEHGDLDSPGFSAPIKLTFPVLDLYTLPPVTPLKVDTVIDQICATLDPLACSDPFLPVSREFNEQFDIDIGAPVEKFRRGDTNGDGALDLSDAVATLTYLFLGGQTLKCPDSADTNDDGVLDLSDPVSLLGFQFLGGPAPAAPGPAQCGADPTHDELGACTYNC
jgi:hypothetical protein